MNKELPAYLLHVDVEYSCSYVAIDDDREIYDFHGKMLPPNWTLPPHVFSMDKLPLRDFVSGIDRVFVSQYACESLNELLAGSVEFRNIGKIK